MKFFLFCVHYFILLFLFGIQGEAVTTLVGHTQCVSAVVWSQHETVYSVSWDHTIRSWNPETGKDTLNMVCKNIAPYLSLFLCVWFAVKDSFMRKTENDNLLFA